jgi:transposase-like protein
MVRTIFAQPDADSVREQHARIVCQLEGRFAEAAALLDEAGPEILAFTAQPKEHWHQLWSTDESVKGPDHAAAPNFGRWMGQGGCS